MVKFILRKSKLVGGGVAASDVVEELPLDVKQQSRSTDAEQLVLQPLLGSVSQLGVEARVSRVLAG